MRRTDLGCGLLSAIVATLAFAGPSRATSSITVIWDETAERDILTSNFCEPRLIRASLRVTGDRSGIGAFSVSLEFDPDGQNELDVALGIGRQGRAGGREQIVDLPSSDNLFAPLYPGFDSVVESEPGSPGILKSFDSAATGSGLIQGSRTIGSIHFVARPFASANTSVRLSVDPAVDFVLDSKGRDVSDQVLLLEGRVFRGRPSVIVGDPCPEPHGSVASAWALASIAALRRRSSRPRVPRS